MVAGTGSGCGKTSVTCALLDAMKRLKKNVAAFKCGPDYIDPMFHRKTTGIDSFNLDIYLMGIDGVTESLGFHSASRDIAIIEGAMGLYDGIGKGTEASSNHLARLTKTPTVLVVDTKGKAASICAEIKGYMNFETNTICGVILNRTKPQMYAYYKEVIESRCGVTVIGYLPSLPEADIQSRYLGLITVDEIHDVQERIAILGDNALKSIDFETLFKLAQCEPIQETAERFLKPCTTIYVAQDDAFCFHYADNYRMLEAVGAELRFFSPLRDAAIAADADGLIFQGGYPELYAAQIAANEPLKIDIRKKHEQGLPIYAECGGFMYMLEHLVDTPGKSHEMLGIIPGKSHMTDRLQQFGYVELESRNDNILCGKGEKIKAHSFHYSTATNEGNDFSAVKANGSGSFPCIFATEKLFAGYPHLHFGGNRQLAANFVKACTEFRKSINGLHNRSGGN